MKMKFLCANGELSLLLLVACIIKAAGAFQTLRSTSNGRHATMCRATPFENETPEERNERIKLVKQIKQSFYKPDEIDETEAPEKTDMCESLPLFRVQWTELPGCQNILNIHVPRCTHMFRNIMTGPKPWRFGHIFLPGDSENLSNSEYSLDDPKSQATRIGTLMQISDVLELQDGRLAMIVQGLERFEVVHAQQHAPHAKSSIRLLQDEQRME